MALTLIQEVRLSVGDVDPALPILSDEEYDYFLEKNYSSVRRASLDAARTILFKLSISATDETVDILSIKGSKAASAYKEALQLYLRSPDLNPVYTSVSGYAGGISKTDYQANILDSDNKAVITPVESLSLPTQSASNPFLI